MRRTKKNSTATAVVCWHGCAGRTPGKDPPCAAEQLPQGSPLCICVLIRSSYCCMAAQPALCAACQCAAAATAAAGCLQVLPVPKPAWPLTATQASSCSSLWAHGAINSSTAHPPWTPCPPGHRTRRTPASGRVRSHAPPGACQPAQQPPTHQMLLPMRRPDAHVPSMIAAIHDPSQPASTQQHRAAATAGNVPDIALCLLSCPAAECRSQLATAAPRVGQRLRCIHSCWLPGQGCSCNTFMTHPGRDTGASGCPQAGAAHCEGHVCWSGLTDWKTQVRCRRRC